MGLTSVNQSMRIRHGLERTDGGRYENLLPELPLIDSSIAKAKTNATLHPCA